MAQESGMSCTPGVLKFAMVLLGLVLGVYIVGPPLYWQVMEDIALVKRGASCASCECDCSSEAATSFSTIPPGLSNLSLADCGKQNPEIRQEIERNLTDLLSEELRLHKSVAEEQQQRAEVTLRSANKLASQYQKEAEKCNAGMETCEGARERTHASIVSERKMSALWEKRARQMGWNN